MSFVENSAIFAAALFLGILLAMEAGRRIGIAVLARESDRDVKGAGSAEGAVLALLGLLIAFSFSGAATRFEQRRHLITQEANAIGTAYLRIDLLSENARAPMRELFRRYLDARLDTYRNIDDLATVDAKLAESAALQNEIWSKAVAATQTPSAAPQAGLLLLPALNEMIDITTTRLVATRNHPPQVINILLGVLSLVGALLAGYSMSGNKVRSWLHQIVFATMMAMTLYVVLDLEYPRRGLIRIDSADQILVELRASMK
jgi:hypothetical protein